MNDVCKPTKWIIKFVYSHACSWRFDLCRGPREPGWWVTREEFGTRIEVGRRMGPTSHYENKTRDGPRRSRPIPMNATTLRESWETDAQTCTCAIAWKWRQGPCEEGHFPRPSCRWSAGDTSTTYRIFFEFGIYLFWWIFLV